MFGRSFELVKASYTVLRQDKELLVFPFLSTLGLIIVTILFMIPMAATGIFEAASTTTTAADGTTETTITNAQAITAFIFLFLFYLVTYTVIIFSNTALIGAALMRLRGEDPTVADGFRIARERMGAIIGYAAISATVGMILQAIRGDGDNIVAQIAASIIGTAWNLITFLVVPVLVIENVGPIEAIKRSGTLLKRTWGENVVATFGMGIVQLLAMLAVGAVVGLPMYLIASAIGSTFVTVIAVAIVVIALAAVALFFSALNGIFQAALYNYATEGDAGEFFPTNMVEGAFQHK